jgi:recombination protein RecA
MSQALRKLSSLIAKTQSIVIFVNQIRMKIGMMFGNPETTPGGKALKFYSSVRIDLRRIAQIKKGEEVIGSRIKAKVVKNKVAPPFRIAEFDIMFNEGISYEGDIINTGLKYGIIKKSAATLSYGNVKLGVGFEKAKLYLKENPAFTKQILSDIHKAVRGSIES